MAILPETLNAMLVAYEAHTGVYQSRNRGVEGKHLAGKIAIVVKVHKGTVFYLSLSASATIELHNQQSLEFLRDYPVELYHYPVLRAVRLYASWVRNDHFPITDEARKVINAIIAR